MLIPNSTSGSIGMSTIALPESDTFSPFGIAIVNSSSGSKDNVMQKTLFVSDHSSSRVISSHDINNLTANSLQSHISYWTSPSQKYPTTLPSQIVADNLGENIYFPQHGGNRISKINVESGIMTEYDIPAGPLSTAVFIAVSDDGNKVWFTEWASNKVAYLDTTVQIPFNLEIKNDNTVSPIILEPNQPKILNVQVSTDKNNSSITSSFSSPLSLTEVELAVIGMTDSGLRGIAYNAQPQRINMENNSTSESTITLNVVQQNNNNIPVRLDQYTAMVKASAPEKDQLLFVSLLYPMLISLDLPSVSQQQQQQQQEDNKQSSEGQDEGFIQDSSLRSIVRIVALPAAIGLIGYIVYVRIKKSKSKK
jgi:DNA-binding beta-propeller fold protein YncE